METTKPAVELKGVQNIGEPDGWWIEVDGIKYPPESIAGVMAWARKIQFDTLDSILQDRGLLALDASLIKKPEETDLGEGWSLMVNPILSSHHVLAGLKVPIEMLHYKSEDEKHRELKEKIGKLGDAIWRLVKRDA